MPYICLVPESYDGKKVGTGECVAFVQEAASAPNTSTWKKGAAVRGNLKISKGTAIATFDSAGKYANLKTGNHAAIYVSQDGIGIWVYDQWRAQGAVLKRQIRFKGGAGSPSNDGDAFSVIE
ncbi:MAG TPA: BPSL0067 family protein [Ignavibacteriaceae bacterium]|nr:BPSL0067 family protein [Ignavibacteriaceae bacterium]